MVVSLLKFLLCNATCLFVVEQSRIAGALLFHRDRLSVDAFAKANRITAHPRDNALRWAIHRWQGAMTWKACNGYNGFTVTATPTVCCPPPSSTPLIGLTSAKSRPWAIEMCSGELTRLLVGSKSTQPVAGSQAETQA